MSSAGSVAVEVQSAGSLYFSAFVAAGTSTWPRTSPVVQVGTLRLATVDVVSVPSAAAAWFSASQSRTYWTPAGQFHGPASGPMLAARAGMPRATAARAA